MPIPLPQLDNITYRDLVDEALALIPALSAEWTDHNPTDPGITLIELFAWISEMLIYRTDQVTQEHQHAFLRLLNGPHADGSEWQPSDDLDEDIRATVVRLRERYRMVTRKDYEQLVLEAFDQVARSKCVPLRNLSEGTEPRRTTRAAGHVSLIVVPSLTFDHVFVHHPISSQFEDVTHSSMGQGTETVAILADVTDTLYCGLVNQPFCGVQFDLDTLGEGYAPLFEIYDSGSGWTALDSGDALLDATNGFSFNGVVWHQIRENWTPTAINDVEAYWLRVSTTVSASITARARKILPRVLQPSAELTNQLLDYLAPRRLLTVHNHVVGPIYAPISAEILVVARNDVRPDALRKKIVNAFSGYIDPLLGGPDGRGWPFGRPLYTSELYSMLEALPEVDFITEIALSSQCTGLDPRCISAQPLWHDDGELIGLLLQAHHLPWVKLDPQSIVVASSSVSLRINATVVLVFGADPIESLRSIKTVIRQYFSPLYSGPSHDWQDSSWQVGDDDLKLLIEEMAQVSACHVQLQGESVVQTSNGSNTLIARFQERQLADIQIVVQFTDAL